MSDFSVRFELARDTAADWTSKNPVLLQGEPGWETDTGKLKIGDGATAWVNLAYSFVLAATAGEAGGIATLDSSGNVPSAQLGNVASGSFVPIAQVGEALGVASLDSSGNVPANQLGNAPGIGNLDGGTATTVYTTSQVVDGGNANG